MEGIIFRTSFNPQNVRVMSVPEPSLLYRIIYVRRRYRTHSQTVQRTVEHVCLNSCFMKALSTRGLPCSGFHQTTDLLVQNLPRLFLHGKTPHFNNAGATFTNWSTRGTYFPALCHISRKTKLNLTSFCSID